MKEFTSQLFERMKSVNAAIDDLELYEFRYALSNLCPKEGWGSIQLESMDALEKKISSRDFYESIQTKKVVGEKVVLDEQIIKLSRMLFVGLVNGDYPVAWINAHFYFDIRAFLFFHRTRYFSNEVTTHFGRKPWRSFEPLQKKLDRVQEIGFRAFRSANAEIDQAFIDVIVRLIDLRGTPILMTLAGPTAAGKTEIMERLYNEFSSRGKKITTIEMDNFLLDRELRGEGAIGEKTTHFALFKQSLSDILSGKQISIPRYDFINATSSHDPQGNLRPGRTPLQIEPADIVFIEGNFPFQTKEISNLIGIKVVYLTDDPVRLKRKWKRDIDYRKKYDPTFFVNRYFKTQFLRADDCYLTQMQYCDIVVDTTGAALWVTPDLITALERR